METKKNARNRGDRGGEAGKDDGEDDAEQDRVLFGVERQTFHKAIFAWKPFFHIVFWLQIPHLGNPVSGPILRSTTCPNLTSLTNFDASSLADSIDSSYGYSSSFRISYLHCYAEYDDRKAASRGKTERREGEHKSRLRWWQRDFSRDVRRLVPCLTDAPFVLALLSARGPCHSHLQPSFDECWRIRRLSLLTARSPASPHFTFREESSIFASFISSHAPSHI